MTMFWDAGAYATRGECDAGLGLFGERSLRDPRAPGSTPTMYQQALGTAYRGFGHVEFSGDGRHMDLCAPPVNRPSRVSFENALRPGATTLTGEVVTVNTGNVVKCLEGPRAPWDTGVSPRKNARGEEQHAHRQGVAALRRLRVPPCSDARHRSL